MPFKSRKQERYMYKNEPEIAKKWEDKYGTFKPKKKKKSKSKITKHKVKQ